MPTYADVILPVPLRKVFCYEVPAGMVAEVKAGVRVCVPLGNSKLYAGIVSRLHHDTPENVQIKQVISVLDAEPVVNAVQLEFWRWMADYYLCTQGDVMACALPSGFKLDSETKLVLHPDFDGDVSGLDERQLDILSALAQRGEITMEEASRAASQAKVFPLVRGLRERGAVLVKEEIEQRYKPLEETYIRWSETYLGQPDAQHALFDAVEKKHSSRQLDVLLAYMTLFPAAVEGWVPKAGILEKAQGGQAALQTLVKKGVFDARKQTQSRLKPAPTSAACPPAITLSPAQQKAFDTIKEGLKEKNVCLLHGVTSSGKTEIYIKLIQEVMAQGKQALFLLPEIALSTQMINRLRKYFGDKVGVYHSRYNEAEKVEIWQQTGRRYQVILGARSALFLPYTNLGLVVVDEEHETSYKQQDPAPRYQARDAAIYLAHLHGAKTVLGSATPSLESYYNAIHGKYALATLFTRYNDVRLPQVWVADMREERKQKTIQGNNFSSLLVEKMNAALQAGKQIILFQNRRGFSHRLECADCGYVPACPRCDVTLTYHKYQNVLMCHYCGHTETAPHVCPQCGGAQMRLKGFGTERIEEDLNLLFPEAKVARMDLDSTRAKDSYRRIIEDFEHRKTDILVGTQMVTKGLDFDNVGVVGIVDADGLISFPDFRAYERSFHLMTQVSGRAGRKGGGGEVVIQTHRPEYSVIQEVMNSDYASMYTTQLQERLTFQYPPFYRLIRLSVRHKDERLVGQASAFLAEQLRMKLGDRVLGPQFPMVSRINLYYLREILIKIERSPKSEAMKKSVLEALDDFYADTAFRAVRVVIDVDP